ncbi:flavoprotein [Aspergillus ambiguus]|uniref:putative flavoprotein n=1 Tax=Aspergillus ambiguus TaxID=176160 RepID=UPI003CCCED74
MSVTNPERQPGTPQSPAAGVAASLDDGKTHLLLAATGSVATIKLPLIITALSKHPSISIRVILTKSAAHFLPPPTEHAPPHRHEQPTTTTRTTTIASAEAYLRTLPNIDGVYMDEDEWAEPWTRGGEILHIALRRWAHQLLIAPLSANSLAKIVHGFADNLLTNVVRAWDASGAIDGKVDARIIVAPAMNTAMWVHPVTVQQIRVLEEEWGVREPELERGPGMVGWFEVLRPIEKSLACGDVGGGGMMEWTDIVAVVERRLRLKE